MIDLWRWSVREVLLNIYIYIYMTSTYTYWEPTWSMACALNLSECVFPRKNCLLHLRVHGHVICWNLIYRTGWTCVVTYWCARLFFTLLLFANVGWTSKQYMEMAPFQREPFFFFVARNIQLFIYRGPIHYVSNSSFLESLYSRTGSINVIRALLFFLDIY